MLKKIREQQQLLIRLTTYTFLFFETIMVLLNYTILKV